MKLGKFTIQKGRWYYNSRELANPIVIVWKLILWLPLMVSLTILALIVALFERDISEFERIWTETL